MPARRAEQGERQRHGSGRQAGQDALTLLRVIPRLAPVPIERDANLALAAGSLRSEISAINLDGAGVRDEQRVPYDPRLGGRVALGRLGAVGGASGGVVADRVAEDGSAEGSASEGVFRR